MAQAPRLVRRDQVELFGQSGEHIGRCDIGARITHHHRNAVNGDLLEQRVGRGTPGEQGRDAAEEISHAGARKGRGNHRASARACIAVVPFEGQVRMVFRHRPIPALHAAANEAADGIKVDGTPVVLVNDVMVRGNPTRSVLDSLVRLALNK